MWVLIIGVVLGFETILDVPARFMWGWDPGTDGYCGSCSTQMAGIYFGNYISQDRVRKKVRDREIYIERNLAPALDALDLKYNMWESSKEMQYRSFFRWIKRNLNQGNVVIIGVMWKGPLEKAHEPMGHYDHIVPVIGYSSEHNDDEYHEGDELYWYDLYRKERVESVMKDFVQSREECSQTDMPSLPYSFCLPKRQNWGVAISGNRGKTLPVRLTVPWKEPDYSRLDGKGSPPCGIDVTVTVLDLDPEKEYTLYRFNNTAFLPDSDFSKSDFDLSWDIPIGSESFETRDRIQSDSTTFYRAALADAEQAIGSMNPVKFKKQLRAPKKKPKHGPKLSTQVTKTNSGPGLDHGPDTRKSDAMHDPDPDLDTLNADLRAIRINSLRAEKINANLENKDADNLIQDLDSDENSKSAADMFAENLKLIQDITARIDDPTEGDEEVEVNSNGVKSTQLTAVSEMEIAVFPIKAKVISQAFVVPLAVVVLMVACFYFQRNSSDSHLPLLAEDEL